MATKTLKVKVLTEYCKGCGLCVSVCKQGSLKLEGPINKMGYRTVVMTTPEQCTHCHNCVMMCPDAGIEIVEE